MKSHENGAWLCVLYRRMVQMHVPSAVAAAIRDIVSDQLTEAEGLQHVPLLLPRPRFRLFEQVIVSGVDETDDLCDRGQVIGIEWCTGEDAQLGWWYRVQYTDLLISAPWLTPGHTEVVPESILSAATSNLDGHANTGNTASSV